MSFIITFIIIIAAVVLGAFLRPIINKEAAIAKTKLLSIEDIIKGEIDTEAEKIKKILDLLKL